MPLFLLTRTSEEEVFAEVVNPILTGVCVLWWFDVFDMFACLIKGKDV